MMGLTVFGAIFALVLGVFIVGLLSRPEKTTKGDETAKSPDQLKLPMNESLAKPKGMAAGQGSKRLITT